MNGNSGFIFNFENIVIRIADETGRVTGKDRIVRDIPGHDGAGPDNGVGSNGNSRQHDDIVSEKTVAADRDGANAVPVSGAHDIDHDHRSVVAQKLTAGGNPDVVAELDQMGIGSGAL